MLALNVRMVIGLGFVQGESSSVGRIPLSFKILEMNSKKERISLTQFVESFCTECERYEHICQSLHQRLGHEETRHVQGSYTLCWIKGTGCET